MSKECILSNVIKRLSYSWRKRLRSASETLLRNSAVLWFVFPCNPQPETRNAQPATRNAYIFFKSFPITPLILSPYLVKMSSTTFLAVPFKTTFFFSAVGE